MNRPNVILIMVDQMRGDCIGADGNTYIETPNLDYPCCPWNPVSPRLYRLTLLHSSAGNAHDWDEPVAYRHPRYGWWTGTDSK